MKNGSGSRESKFDMLDSTDSPIMPTRYAHGSSKLIRSIEKTFYPIIVLIAALIVFAILDITDVISKYNILPDRTYDIIITFVAAILLAVVVYLLYTLVKSRKKLHHWADIFERNSIKAGLTISMSTTSKEHVLGALSETIEGIGEPLREYLTSSPNSYKNLIDVQIDKDTVFDILIDKDHLTNRTPSNQVSSITLSSKTTSTSIPDTEQPSKEISDLVESTRRYGAIAARVISGRINKENVKSFQAALRKYISSTRNKVALALIIGEGIDEEADNLSKLRIKGIDYFILIEKTM
ncbi:MAG: FeoB-associated Cys-rich membrane protein [Nitrososphaeraceae archaeon]